MLFNSYSFIFLFLPATFAGMFWLGRHSGRLAALWLGMASLFFYAVWDPRFVLLLLASIAFNYGAGYAIGLQRAAGKQQQAGQLLAAAIAINLVLLGYFKYTNFFLGAANQLLAGHVPALDIILPLGISFFTFTQIAFLVDVRRGIAKEYNFIHYLLFVTYFPHLIAGPVLHHKQMMPQFANPATYRINAENVAVGLTIFAIGLAKKVLVADNLANYATPIFDRVSDGYTPMLAEAWIGALSYTLQLYFDFSGYSDMAIGLSLLFNVRLPLNFNSPYKATSIIDFWRRWHMTLSAFLRDYLYFALGGNRKGAARRYANLWVTMLLGGLWHGAGWTFLVWGGLHGVYLMINHGWRDLRARLGWGEGGRVAKLAAGALTFTAVVVGWVVFRADSLATAGAMLAGMSGGNGISLPAVLEGRLGWLAGESAWVDIVFVGLAPALQGNPNDPLSAGFWFFAALVVIWLCPNVRQILAAYKPSWEDISGIRVPPGQPQGRIARWLIWRPTRIHAVAMALLLILSLDSLSTVSEFLYYRF
jgi:alginate O-acetyltransferase complex protein AlgI